MNHPTGSAGHHPHQHETTAPEKKPPRPATVTRRLREAEERPTDDDGTHDEGSARPLPDPDAEQRY